MTYLFPSTEATFRGFLGAGKIVKFELDLQALSEAESRLAESHKAQEELETNLNGSKPKTKKEPKAKTQAELDLEARMAEFLETL
jgi:hypothetical protein